MVICDLDGTLVDSFADIRWGLARAVEAIGCAVTPDILALDRSGLPLEACYRLATGRDPGAGANASELEAFVTAYRENYWDNPEPGLAYDGVADTLTRLRERHPDLALAVATTKRTDMAVRVVERAGLADCFDLVQGSDDLPKKPDPTLLRVVATSLGRPIERAVMVGDTDKDIGAARAAGCTAVGVTYGGWGQRLAQLPGESGPHHLIDHFAELEVIVTAAARE